MFELDGNRMYLQQYLNQGLGGICGGFGGCGFGMSPFGSIFDCSDNNFDFMAGVGVGNAVVNVLGMFASQKIAEHRANKAAKAAEVPAKEQIKNITEQIDERKDELALEDRGIDPKYNTAIENAKNNLSNNTTKLTQKRSELSSAEAQLNAETDPEKQAKIQQTIENIKKEVETLEALEIQYQKDIEEAENAKQKAIEAKEKELNEEISDLENKRAKLQKQVEQTDLNDADGNKLQRVSNEKLQSLFDNNNTLDKDAKVSVRTLRAAILGYSSAKTDNAKTLYKNQFNQIWAKLENEDPSSLKDNSLKKAYDIINK